MPNSGEQGLSSTTDGGTIPNKADGSAIPNGQRDTAIQLTENQREHTIKESSAADPPLKGLHLYTESLGQHNAAETAAELVARTATLGSRWNWLNWTYASF
jgi:hypothetical protein